MINLFDNSQVTIRDTQPSKNTVAIQIAGKPVYIPKQFQYIAVNTTGAIIIFQNKPTYSKGWKSNELFYIVAQLNENIDEGISKHSLIHIERTRTQDYLEMIGLFLQTKIVAIPAPKYILISGQEVRVPTNTTSILINANKVFAIGSTLIDTKHIATFAVDVPDNFQYGINFDTLQEQYTSLDDALNTAIKNYKTGNK